VGSLACLVGAASVPIARGDEAFRDAGARVAAVAFVALLAAVVNRWTFLVPIAVALAGGIYAAELAISDAPLDLAAPAIAVALFLAAELAYWSLDESERIAGDPGDGLRRATVVALLGVMAFLVAAALLALADEVRARGIAVDIAGATAAVAALATVVLLASRSR
jgi:hypothetical protein